MSPLRLLEAVQQDYRRYVYSFQFIASEDVTPVLTERLSAVPAGVTFSDAKQNEGRMRREHSA